MARWTPNTYIDSMLQAIEDDSEAIWVLSSGVVNITFDQAKTWKMASATIASTFFTIGDAGRPRSPRFPASA